MQRTGLSSSTQHSHVFPRTGDVPPFFVVQSLTLKVQSWRWTRYPRPRGLPESGLRKAESSARARRPRGHAQRERARTAPCVPGASGTSGGWQEWRRRGLAASHLCASANCCSGILRARAGASTTLRQAWHARRGGASTGRLRPPQRTRSELGCLRLRTRLPCADEVRTASWQHSPPRFRCRHVPRPPAPHVREEGLATRPPSGLLCSPRSKRRWFNRHHEVEVRHPRQRWYHLGRRHVSSGAQLH